MRGLERCPKIKPDLNLFCALENSRSFFIRKIFVNLMELKIKITFVDALTERNEQGGCGRLQIL